MDFVYGNQVMQVSFFIPFAVRKMVKGGSKIREVRQYQVFFRRI